MNARRVWQRLQTGCVGIAVVAVLAAGFVETSRAADLSSIRVENTLEGTSAWLVRQPRQREIAGYVDDVSYRPGDLARLFVDSHGAPFTYEIFRMGHYGGAGGRLVASAADPIANGRQPRPTVRDDRTNGAKLLLTGWHESTRFAIPEDWLTGFYLIKMTRLDNGAQSYACFVLRAPSPARVVLVFPTSTWQAYNGWGGLSLYRDTRRRRPGIARTRAHKVSFLRPHTWDHGAGFFFNRERPLVEWLESRGYPVSYATDRDTLFRRLVGPATKLVILSGHPEYHSTRERNYYAGLGKRGISLAIFGGNSFITQARFSPDGEVETVWRDRELDPVKGRFATLRWELVGWHQNRLTGSMDGAGEMGSLRAVASRHWAWAGAGVADGQKIGAVQGWEQDGLVRNRSTPRRVQVLARAVVRAGTRTPRIASMTVIPGPRRTFVFNGAQNGFTWNFGYPAYPGVDPRAWIWDRYPAYSQENAAIKRLAGNVIARATGLPNPEPARPRTLPGRARLTLLSPARGQVVPARRPNVLVWAGVPRRAARLRIVVDGRFAGSVPAWRSTWTGPALRSTGPHSVRLAAVDRSGNVVARRTSVVNAVSPRYRGFTVIGRSGPLWRAWG